MLRYLVSLIVLVIVLSACGAGGELLLPPPGDYELVPLTPLAVSDNQSWSYSVGDNSWTVYLKGVSTAQPTQDAPTETATPLPPTAVPVTSTPTPTLIPPTAAPTLAPTVTPTLPSVPSAARELSLVADLAFTPDQLPPQTRLWYERARYAMLSERQYPDAEEAALSGNNYAVARTLDNHITALMTILAATGDPAALEEIWRLSELARSTYADTGGGYLGLVWKYCEPDYPNCNTDYNGLDESLLFGFQARIAYVMHVNRHLDARYAESAEWWTWVGLEQQWQKWIERKGAYDWALIYPWAAELDNTDYLTLDKSLTHAYTAVASGWLLYGAILDNAEHLAEGERRAGVLFSMMEGTSSYSWDHRVPGHNKEPYGCEPSGYASHAASQWFVLYLAHLAWFDDAGMTPIARTWGNLLSRADTSADTYPGDVCGSGSDRLARVTINNIGSYALWDARIAHDIERIYNDQQSPNTPQSINIPASLTLFYAVEEGYARD